MERTCFYISDVELADAIAEDQGTPNHNRWTAIDDLVRRVAEDGAGKNTGNAYEHPAFDDEWREGLNSGDISVLRDTLEEIWESFYNAYN